MVNFALSCAEKLAAKLQKSAVPVIGLSR